LKREEHLKGAYIQAGDHASHFMPDGARGPSTLDPFVTSWPTYVPRKKKIRGRRRRKEDDIADIAGSFHLNILSNE
jgi:hypothetical protein